MVLRFETLKNNVKTKENEITEIMLPIKSVIQDILIFKNQHNLYRKIFKAYEQLFKKAEKQLFKRPERVNCKKRSNLFLSNRIRCINPDNSVLVDARPAILILAGISKILMEHNLEDKILSGKQEN